MSEQYTFEADISQLMGLIINTFYSNNEIFLRELISNASDALDKARYASLTDSKALSSTSELLIKLHPDKDSKTLTITDTGIGMTKNELVENLGTIAKSGTKLFTKQLKESADVSLIGQFGVGFYSAFLVAHKVEVISKSDQEQTCYKWTSQAKDTFDVSEAPNEDIPRGTKIILHLKQDQLEYLEESRLKDIVKKHSQFVHYPINLRTMMEEEVEPEENATQDDKSEEQVVEETEFETTNETEAKTEVETKDGDEEDRKVSSDTSENKESVTLEEVNSDDEDDDQDGNTKSTEKETILVPKWVLLNKQKPIWMRDQKDVTREEYAEFYKSLTNDWQDYLQVMHFKVEGNVEFTAVLFVPKRPPFDMFSNREKRKNINLYVKRVFITDDYEDLLPAYFSFIRGVVDSQDLPLNVSREMLQESGILKVMKTNLTKRAIKMCEEIAEDEKLYKNFYENYSKNLKLGIHEDADHRTRLSKLLRYRTSSSGSNMVSLAEYVKRMPEDQEHIYYITGENYAAVSKSPFLEKLIKRGWEVVFMVENIDEYVVQQLKTFEDKKLVCATKEGLTFMESDDEKKIKATKRERFKPFVDHIASVLNTLVEKVVLSDRLLESPCVLVTAEFGWSANMQRIMAAQALKNDTMSQYMIGKKTLEINPDNAIIQQMFADFTDNKLTDLSRDIYILYETSLLTSGFTLSNPNDFARRVYGLMEKGKSAETKDQDHTKEDSSVVSVAAEDTVDQQVDLLEQKT